MSNGVSPFAPNIMGVDYLDDVYTVMSDITTKQVIAFPDVDNVPQNLYIGATSNLVLQSKSDLKVNLAPNSAFRIFETTGTYNSTLRETQMLSVSTNSNITSLTVGDTAS